MQLIVSVKKLNQRSSVPASLAEKNIIGTVQQGFRFEGEEVTEVKNPALGKWYKDRDNSYYWGGGLVIEQPRVDSNINGLPVNLPLNFKVGIDISHYNQHPDWTAINDAGVSFVYIKISEGVGTPDMKAKEHADNAKQSGLRIGYYHFCRPDKRNGGFVESDATAEADEALKIITGLQKPDLPLVLDLEDQTNWDTPLTKPDYLLWVTTFLNRINEMSGTDCIIYSRKEYLERKLPIDHNLGRYKLWLSYYPSLPDANKITCPAGWVDWAIWQYTEIGVIGDNPKIDINVSKDDSIFLT